MEVDGTFAINGATARFILPDPGGTNQAVAGSFLLSRLCETCRAGILLPYAI
jgi:hypothetical protein